MAVTVMQSLNKATAFHMGPGELFLLTFFVMAAWNNGDHYIDLYRIPLQKYPYQLNPLPLQYTKDGHISFSF